MSVLKKRQDIKENIALPSQDTFHYKYIKIGNSNFKLQYYLTILLFYYTFLSNRCNLGETSFKNIQSFLLTLYFRIILSMKPNNLTK